MTTAFDSSFFEFFEFWIWTNHNSLLSIATNQFASFFIEIRSQLYGQDTSNTTIHSFMIIYIAWARGHYMRSAYPGGEGALKTKLIRRGSAPRSDPLPFYPPFLAEDIPLSFTFHWQMVLLWYTFQTGSHFHAAFNKLKQQSHKVCVFDIF